MMMNSSMMFYMSNPELMKRYFPHLFKGGAGGGGGMPGIPGAGGGDADSSFGSAANRSKPTSNTNLVTINIKFRAVNLNKRGDSAANGTLAYTVEKEFKASYESLASEKTVLALSDLSRAALPPRTLPRLGEGNERSLPPGDRE